jgi:pSer/pThr/pTyr-binding forkhead associated (FHA) protein
MERSRNPTPRVNPAPAPGKKPQPDSDRPRPLRGAALLTTLNAEYTLYSERVLIGRGPNCQVVVMDPLVSREHAVLLITPDHVMVEDLRSANGVYVNNVRIFERQQLYDGDRLLVGTQELCLFSAEPRRALTSEVAPSAKTGQETPPSSRRLGSSAVATERADALVVLGRVARRMLGVGLPGEAERVLSDHLNKVLYGARSGLAVPRDICVTASREALMLAKALGAGRWLNYAVELHLRAKLEMTPETGRDVAETAPLVSGTDHALFGRYVEWLRDRAAEPGSDAALLLPTLENVELGA